MKDPLFNLLKQTNQTEEFDAIRIGLASPEMIRSWSYGEVKKSETINYRTFKPERDGLFCAKIFGPIRDYECSCGKYKRLKHRGVVCEKCGVEVTLAKVRRERMGHIELASPVAHIWFLKSLPSRMGLLLDMTLRDIERVLYFEAFVVIEPGMTPMERGQILTDEQYLEAIEEHGDEFDARMGAEAIHELLRTIDLTKEILLLREEIPASGSETKIKKLTKRLKLMEAFVESGNQPDWMILNVLPVLPPDLHPLVPLDGGRFATSDLNDLYRRVINRNNRLKRLLDLNAPDIIVRNEKRMLQEAVDALLDNGRRGKAITGSNKRQLKSLADIIKGKQGRFRQNLLGKRVDYSGRSVIVVGPTLKLHQCGLPKKMALELFKPFIFSKLERLNIATTIKAAKKKVEQEDPVVWDILEEVIREHPVMLNRAPTLHRLGIQAFEPVLIEGKAIQLHPLVCAAFNADFDGDQMAVHVPLSLEAQLEARVLMMSTNNVLSPANGEPIIVPSQDVVLGLYYMTRERIGAKGEGMFFADFEEVHRAYENRAAELHARIHTRIIEEDSNGKMNRRRVETTVGRALLYEIVPKRLTFDLVNQSLTKKAISRLINTCYRQLGLKDTVIFADQLMYTGFTYATRSGVSIGVDDMVVPDEKRKILHDAEAEVKEIEQQYAAGFVTKNERYNKVVDIWSRTNDKVAKAMMDKLGTEYTQPSTERFARDWAEHEIKRLEAEQQASGVTLDRCAFAPALKARLTGYLPEGVALPSVATKQASFNSIYMMADSGARGSPAQIRQLAGMRGLMTKPDGSIIETPIKANFREGLDVLQYFISTHGARKGLADTALKTANSGYLTRRLVDVAQDLVVTEQDCGTLHGLTITSLVEGGDVVEPLRERVLGRVASEEVFIPGTTEVLIPAGSLLDEHLVELLESNSVEHVKVRSPITCETRHGICAKCYGRDLGRGHLVNVGEAIGVIAAQSIGEPGTQLTMRTFHIGGAASRAAAVSNVQIKSKGVVRLHNIKIVQHSAGHRVAVSRSGELTVVDEHGRERERYKIPYGAVLTVGDGEEVAANQVVMTWDPHTRPIITEVAGILRFQDFQDGITVNRQLDEVTGLSSLVITDPKLRGTAAKELRPMIKLVDDQDCDINIAGTDLPAHYFLPAGAVIGKEDGARVGVGDEIARISQESTKTRDITGGLPRVADLFEARKPKDPAVLAEVSGTVSFGKDTKGKQRLIITPSDGSEPHEELIPKWRQVIVFEGEHVERGEVLVEGAPAPHDILRLLGVSALANHIIDEVQDVYRLQGVKINDKHIEVIVRQMLRKVEIIDPGETRFLKGEQLERSRVLEDNEKMTAQDKWVATFEPVLLGITKASLATESFISAASFQETTRVLTEASVNGKRDDLRGLKENVIVGRLIPAGTGLAYHLERRRRRELGLPQIQSAPLSLSNEIPHSAALLATFPEMPKSEIDAE
ncbi:RNA polymerase subunit beta' [Gammaproteobacteria bacterium]